MRATSASSCQRPSRAAIRCYSSKPVAEVPTGSRAAAQVPPLLVGTCRVASLLPSRVGAIGGGPAGPVSSSKRSRCALESTDQLIDGTQVDTTTHLLHVTLDALDDLCK